jgi:hypothetical protein
MSGDFLPKCSNIRFSKVFLHGRGNVQIFKGAGWERLRPEVSLLLQTVIEDYGAYVELSLAGNKLKYGEKRSSTTVSTTNPT